MDYKKKVDELTDLCDQLREQLATKELNEYEQEALIRDLKSQLKEMDDLEEKLSLANRNARLLEEENNDLLMQLKSGDVGTINPSATRPEAMKLIEENNRYQTENQELRTSVIKAHQREQQLDQKCKALIELQEKNESQLSFLKKRNSEIEERLREEQNQFTLAKESWETEKARYLQDYEELLSSVQRLDGATQQRETRDTKDRGNERNLQQELLKEDIAELEKKLRLSEERFRAKEREWRQIEKSLQNEIDVLKVKDQDGKEVYRVFQDQLDSFKQEVTAFRGERRPSRAIMSLPMEELSVDEVNDEMSTVEADLKSKEGKIEALETMNQTLNKKYLDSTYENERLREEIEHLQDINSHLEDRANGLEVRVKELEVLLVSVPKGSVLPKIVKLERERNNEIFDDEDKKMILEENKELREILFKYEDDISQLKAGHEQQIALYQSRQNEQQLQIVELLRQNDIMKQLVSGRNSGRVSNAERLQERQEMLWKENERNLRNKSAFEPIIIDKLSKDKIDCVEDIMKLLEAAWSNEEEIKRQLQKFSSQQSTDTSSIIGNGDQSAKEEELRRRVRFLDERDEERQREMHRYQAEKDRLNDLIGSLQRDNKLKENKIQNLQDRLDILEKYLKDPERILGKDQEKPKQNEMEKRMKMLEAAVAQKELDINGLSKSKDKKLQELNDQLANLRNANDGLWKQLLALQDGKQEPSKRPSSGRTSRTPRGSANRRSMEHLVYSQPSTQMSEERRRTVVADGAHLAVTIVELSDVMRNGKPITEPGYIIIKVKSVKEKYKTSVKELASVIRFDETFVFYLAQPDEDVITLHVFYRSKNSSREYHIGDASFTMATLHRGVPRQRIAIVAQNPGTKDAQRAAQVEVIMQSDDFGKLTVPTEAEIEDEKLRFSELLKRVEVTAPENLHCVDVLMATNAGQ
ncbi:C2 domain [Trypanosoma melophagium]|uniref:C2 domain n=1 Tax=Trypanosoma melophagium TaxID=715481 RepID=UPI00351AA7C2|nr:C2 domain [Trypanosoma melophagium]